MRSTRSQHSKRKFEDMKDTTDYEELFHKRQKTKEKQRIEDDLLEMYAFKEQLTCKSCHEFAFIPCVSDCCNKMVCYKCVQDMNSEQYRNCEKFKKLQQAKCPFCRLTFKDEFGKNLFYVEKYQVKIEVRNYDDKMWKLFQWQERKNCPLQLKHNSKRWKDYLACVGACKENPTDVHTPTSVAFQIWTNIKQQPRKCFHCQDFSFTFRMNQEETSELCAHFKECTGIQRCRRTNCISSKSHYHRVKDFKFHNENPHLEQLSSQVRGLVSSNWNKEKLDDLLMKFPHELALRWNRVLDPSDVIAIFYQSFRNINKEAPILAYWPQN